MGAWGDLATLAAHAPEQRHSQIEQITDAHIAWFEAGGPFGVEGLPAVVGAVRLVSGHIDQLPLTVDGGPLPRWLESPRRFGAPMDLGDLVQYATHSMMTVGFAALSVTRVAGTSWRVEPLDPAGVQCQATSGARVRMRWHIDGVETPTVPAVWRDIADDREYLLAVPYQVTRQRPWGSTPLIDSLASLQGFAKTEDAGANVFDTGTYSGGRLETDQDISGAVAKAYSEQWMKARQSKTLPVLGSGLRYVNDLADSAKLQLLEARAYDQAVIYSLFGIPLDIMGLGVIGAQSSSMSYQNAQDSNRRYRANALGPITTQLEDALSLLLPPGRDATESQRVQFDYSAWEAASAEDEES